MRAEAFAVGLICSSLQMSLIYLHAFLYSATAPAYLSLMLAWFLGGTAGCWLPSSLTPRSFFRFSALAHLLNTWSLTHAHFWGSWWLAAWLGGAAGSLWLCRRAAGALPQVLFWESLGMAGGFLLCSALIYPHGLRLVWLTPTAAALYGVRKGEATADESPQS